MAIKISGTTVIENNRAVINVLNSQVSGISSVGTLVTMTGSTGVVEATTYYGDGSNLSNITSTIINNNADNRLITGSATANTLEGESNLTFSGTALSVGTAVTVTTAGDFQAVGVVTANSFKVHGGTSSQFLKGDGSVDTSSYANTGKAIAMAIVFG